MKIERAEWRDNGETIYLYLEINGKPAIVGPVQKEVFLNLGLLHIVGWDNEVPPIRVETNEVSANLYGFIESAHAVKLWRDFAEASNNGTWTQKRVI